MHFNNIEWVIYESDSYKGLGGIFVKESPQARSGFVIETLKHYLAENYQGDESD